MFTKCVTHPNIRKIEIRLTQSLSFLLDNLLKANPDYYHCIFLREDEVNKHTLRIKEYSLHANRQSLWSERLTFCLMFVSLRGFDSAWFKIS